MTKNPIEHKERTDELRLNKYIGESGLCSRREADKLIDEGRVRINGILAEKGTKVHANDVVTVNGKVIGKREELVYIALNKPRGITCTTDRRVKGNIVDFMNYPLRIFHIGRLDKDSQGLLLMTNDGDIVNKILRSGNFHEKEYIVTVNKPVTKEFIQAMSSGVPILDTVTRPCKIWKLSKDTFKIILTQGLNRQIRRMCEYLDYKVVKLERIRIMNIKLEKLPLGKWRYLSREELKELNALISCSSKNFLPHTIEEDEE